MTAKPSAIKCPKCGYQPNIISDTCLKCETRLEKICGECGFANPVEKNYCELCGALLTLTPPKAGEKPAAETAQLPPPPPRKEHPQLEMESIQDTVREREESARRVPPETSKPPKTSEGADREKAAQALPSGQAGPGQNKSRPPAPPKNFSRPAIAFVLLSALLGAAYVALTPQISRLRLVMTAKAYLTDISLGRFDKAYELLSAKSRAICTSADYIAKSREYYAAQPMLEFRDVQIFSLDKDSAVIGYQLKGSDSAWKPDYISFAREDGRWTRPYIWTLFQPIEDAENRKDFPQALGLAQKLYETDPSDPRSSAYLCETEFFMRLYEKSMQSCRRTLDSTPFYPVGFKSGELYRFNLYYADSLRFLQMDRVALMEYDKLLKWPGLTPEEQCPLLLSRADSLVAVRDYDRALPDVVMAEKVCTENPARDDVKKRMLFMNGGAGSEAIEFAKKSRFQTGMPPIGEAIRRQQEEFKARLGEGNAAFLPQDRWLAEHIAGPEYRVIMRQETLSPSTKQKQTEDVFIFLVNLWTNKAKVEKAPPPPPPMQPPPQGAGGQQYNRGR